ncbi:hypothetical protein ACFT7S_36020 [Streptomyces sp. NPDC057136]
MDNSRSRRPHAYATPALTVTVALLPYATILGALLLLMVTGGN